MSGRSYTPGSMLPVDVALPTEITDRLGVATMTIRPMVRGELDELVAWAAGEGWNPGLDDAEVFWATDPAGFVAATIGDELIGGGSVVSYDGRYGFMGFFIVRPDLRHHGLGRALWFARRDTLLARLDPGAAIELDGVDDMVPFYAAGGFAVGHRDQRYEAIGVPQGDWPTDAGGDLVALADVAWDEIAAYDAAHVPAPRPTFLDAWVRRPGGHALGVHDGRSLRAMVVARPARAGVKVGPLFADDAGAADALLGAVLDRLHGVPVFLDVPMCNPAAVALAERRAMAPVFGCTRMTLGSPPSLPWSEIFGVTTFELG